MKSRAPQPDPSVKPELCRLGRISSLWGKQYSLHSGSFLSGTGFLPLFPTEDTTSTISLSSPMVSNFPPRWIVPVIMQPCCSFFRLADKTLDFNFFQHLSPTFSLLCSKTAKRIGYALPQCGPAHIPPRPLLLSLPRAPMASVLLDRVSVPRPHITHLLSSSSLSILSFL